MVRKKHPVHKGKFFIFCDRNSTTSWPGLNASLPMPTNSWRAVPPWCWPVTTTSCRHRRTSIRLNRWIITRCSNPKAAKHLRVCWLKAGPTRCGNYIQTGHSGHSGITSLNGGRRIKECDSITFYSRQRCRIGSWTVGSIVGHVRR